jgi:CPA2 family monovalent cation:H+ antiporter-2
MKTAVAILLGAVATRLLGWSWSAGLVFGIAISVASTVVLTRVLSDNQALHTPEGHLAIVRLVVEDLFTVIVSVLLPVLTGGPLRDSDPAAALPKIRRQKTIA